MVSRKRAHSEVEAASEQQSKEPGLLERLRNCWEFANLMQYIYIFGKVVKIDEEFGIEDLETECLKPGPSEKLLDIGLSLLKFVSSHRGLTRDNFDEYTRRQYNAKAPHLTNPFGYEEEPNKFNDFDVFMKLRVLHQLSTWTFWNPDRIREKMPEQKETEQTQWRIEELGYDRDDRLYYVLDDNRLYRRTDPPIPPPKAAKPKANTRKARAAARAAKRRKVSEDEEEKDDANENQAEDTSGGLKWECIAVTLAEYQAFIDTIRKTKDPNEQILRDRLLEEVFPVLEKVEESQQRKIAKREKELFNMQLLAGAKRSGRLAQKQEREQREREEAEAAQKREAELAAARKAQEQQKKMEEERRSRMMTREQRIKDREQKRILHEEELRKMAEEQKKLENGEGRVSERHLKAEMEKRKKSLEELAQEDQWIFDCSGCGVHGENLDDGSHSVACERCNVWQHSKCLGIPQQEAEKEDFHFVCKDCKRREEEAKRPKLPPLKFRVGGSSSPPSTTDAVNGEKRKSVDDRASPTPKKLKHISVPHPSETGHNVPAPTWAQNSGSGPLLGQVSQQQPSSQAARAQESVQTGPAPGSPERRSLSFMNGSFGSDGHIRPPFSPSKSINGAGMSPVQYQPRLTSGQAPPQPFQQANYTAPPTPHVHLNRGTFNSPRPSSSHSTQSHSFPSPIQNRPPMSPTQGNRDVGPLAGFPSPAYQNGAASSTPFGQHQTPRPSSASFVPSSSGHSRPPSFSAATPTAGNSFSHTPPPQGSQGIHLSGLSPTKHSPRPLTSGGMAAASILPPIQRLEPSPKLMGRSSPDAPIPPPVKCMTPEQEERRQRENEMMAHARAQAQAQAPAPGGQQMGNPSNQ
ncbi:PHD finger domain protein [Paecilomyces variotii No. 5]|uniref:PHD finger domain protein n=1 Tax=Byssochlamys spectabilis (strain No. 5 / NBRC 109023) TaxID=1356009 RepID=V5HZY9_BYSSN|nr:PHD finger domain protein [Paecilomyces variotii No. 5]